MKYALLVWKDRPKNYPDKMYFDLTNIGDAMNFYESHGRGNRMSIVIEYVQYKDYSTKGLTWQQQFVGYKILAKFEG